MIELLRKEMNSKIRLLFQGLILVLVLWIIFNSADLETYCPMGGILAFGTKVNQGTMPCNMSDVAVFMALGLFVGALAIGKLFCSFICPVGFLSECFGKIGDKFRLQFSLPKLADRLLRSVKYLLLFFVLYFTVTSSELFCRKFDPYFGAGSGFSADTVLPWSLGAVLVTFFGAIFVKQFWCRYLCFLGAVSNIFVNIWGPVIIALIYFSLKLCDVNLLLLWLIGGFVVTGFVIESSLFKSLFLPIMRITVNQNACTQCGLCATACRQDIKVQEFKKVDHPDCVMCTECITACKNEQAVGVNGSFKLRFLPPVLVIALISMGFILSSNFEFTTLEERWGKFNQLESPAIYKQSGIKNIKCWGSSVSLYNVLKSKKGIYGLDTYAKSHAAVIYYDKNEITEQEVKKALFNPNRTKIRDFTEYTPDSLTIWEIGINNLFDSIDQMNFIRVLHQSKFIFGVETFYGEPVLARIFFDADSMSFSDLKSLIEVKKIESQIANKNQVYKMNFVCEGRCKIISKIDVLSFKRSMFIAIDQKFNNYSGMNEKELYIYEIGFPDADSVFMRRNMKYLISHLSADDHIVRYQTTFTDRPVAYIYFHPGFVDTTKIHHMLFADTLVYFTIDTTTEKTPNIFKFYFPSRLITVSDLIETPPDIQ